MQIQHIPYSEIQKVWAEKLWPGRRLIESHSAMTIDQSYDMRNMDMELICYGILHEGNIIAVNSVHLCGDQSMRSRGLWVDFDFRARRLGLNLLEYGIKLAREKGCPFIWSYPRKTSWFVYQRAGFYLTTEWSKSDTSPENALCRLDLK